MLHPTAFVLYRDIEFPLSQEKLDLLKAGYIVKYMDVTEQGYTENDIALIEFELFHKGLGEEHAMENKAAHHPVMIRTNGDVVRVETGDIVGNILKLVDNQL